MNKKRDEVINYLIDKQLIPKLATTFSSQLGNNKEDFIQEMWVIILEIPTEKLITLYENKQLDWYILSVARNQVVNDKSTFNRKYNSKIIEYVSEYVEKDIEEDED